MTCEYIYEMIPVTLVSARYHELANLFEIGLVVLVNNEIELLL